MKLNAWEQAKRHPVVGDRPAPGFFEGALLGNGGLGAVVTTRPDAVVVRFGHNSVWDIRIAENHREELGTFAELFERLKQIPEHYESLSKDEWYREYVQMAADNYGRPYPRPMPCGSLLLGFDRRKAELLGHKLHIDRGLCEVFFLIGGKRAVLEIFVDQTKDELWLAMKPAKGSKSGAGSASPFNRIRLLPDPYTPPELPACRTHAEADRAGGGTLALRQTLPRAERPGKAADPRDRAFRLSARVSGGAGFRPGANALEAALAPGADLLVRVRLDESLNRDVPAASGAAGTLTADRRARREALAASEEKWRAYWSRSGVALEDDFLEAVWYRNLYFFQCAVRPDAACPGLFANWSHGRIGAEWHGDYHMNYNTQQPFWVAFSSNHADKHLAYVNMVDHVLPVSRKWAQEYYGLRGAYYPHSAYPVEMTMMPYPVPHWGWEVCETPWTVQSLWWHYLYTMDKEFLANRAFVPIKEAVLFMVDYMKRPEASGEAWGDDRYHIFPTVVPELYELTPGFRRNRDCLVDLTLTKFLLRSFEQTCAALGREEEERELLAEVADVRGRFPDYPTAESRQGTVFVSVAGEDPDVVYNVPNSVTTVFPGEEHGLHSPPEPYAIAVNSYRNHRNEGGNELVFYHMAGARLGQLDLERFKRQIAYCLLPNGTCTDRLLESGGRYSDETDFDYMGGMGIWFENFALPAVINECLLQSYNGVLRFFPNWPADRRAAFSTLRAVGGFLISAVWEDGNVREIEIYSEAGSQLRIYNPWKEGARITRDGEGGKAWAAGDVIETDTAPGETIRLAKALR
ncbi:glycosyl hydrolase family 95 catalytic domain-containing protein [Cohnella zeiphila]|uniref:Glycoside hydrolase N-terminal domain-containing protein n=1 Tax=Cohnella zeiphila TaxID=2761120 RepID=A0A7X0SRW1_9BACL|nr:glycoside hydrolase N-terminal domain-containing protein [Cohnella zeiphila]MBB6735013.1 glycoside hydrolase N-terminal domain-containing protein [Cohnella zeiphila]